MFERHFFSVTFQKCFNRTCRREERVQKTKWRHRIDYRYIKGDLGRLFTFRKY